MNINEINLTDKIVDESNYRWINNLIDTGISNLIDKLDYDDPIRLVMIPANHCFICNTDNTVVWIEHTDDYKGIYHHYGWQYCKKCTKLMTIFKKNYEKKQPYLTYDKTKNLRKSKYLFWRVSSNPIISPYIQRDGCIIKSIGNSLNILKKNNIERISTHISWKYKNDEYNKMLFLANLIHFNRDILGYNITNLPITNLNKKWTDVINKEYEIANRWSQIIPILYKKMIPSAIIRIICLNWGGFTGFI